MTPIAVRVAVVTVSDSAFSGERDDTSGDAIEAWVRDRGYRLAEREVVPDDQEAIALHLAAAADGGAADVIITTGGTGFTERDVTPEATLEVIERSAPGVAEAIRARGGAALPAAWLSRGVAGIRARCLIVNLPGSTGGVHDGLAFLETVIDHAVQLLRGDETDRHPSPGTDG